MDGKAIREWVSIVISFLALFAAIAAIFYSDRQLKEARNSTERAFMGQRGYVAVEEIKSSGSWKFDATIRVYGGSPVRHFSVDYSCGYSTPDGYDLTGTFNDFVTKDGGGFSGDIPDLHEGRVLNPGSKISFSCQRPVLKKTKGTAKLIKGTIEYQDISGTSHQTNYCYTSPIDFIGIREQCSDGNSIN